MDALVIKYERSGEQKWNLTWGTAGWERCEDITLDSSEYVYITGSIASDMGYLDMFLVKVGYLGEPLWYCTWGLNYNDYAYAIAIDSTNNIYLGGGTESSSGGT